MTKHVVHVSDRTYKDMVKGTEFAHWFDCDVPHVGDRVTIFDYNLDFTQHDVLVQDIRRIIVGPAIPWE